MRATDVEFARLACRRGWLSEEDRDRLLHEADRFVALGLEKAVDEVLLERGVLSTAQVCELRESLGWAPRSSRIGDYELKRRIGLGGMGVVFEARHVRPEQSAALKILYPRLANNAGLRERLIREARVLARLNHPNLVHPIDVGRDGKYFFLALELIEGEDLQQRMAHGKTLPQLLSLEIVIAVLRALEALEKRKLVHCDVKPANILLNSSGDVKLADLGLLRAHGERPPEARGLLHGTPQYVSPEQAQGGIPLDSRSDIYSLGASWFHIVTGRPPFPGRSTAEILDGHLRKPVPSLTAGHSVVSSEVEAVIRRWLSKSPDDRPATCGAALSELEGVQRKLTARSATRARAVARKSLRGPRKLAPPKALGVVAVALLGLAGLGLGLWLVAGRNGTEKGPPSVMRGPESAARCTSTSSGVARGATIAANGSVNTDQPASEQQRLHEELPEGLVPMTGSGAEPLQALPFEAAGAVPADGRDAAALENFWGKVVPSSLRETHLGFVKAFVGPMFRGAKDVFEKAALVLSFENDVTRNPGGRYPALVAAFRASAVEADDAGAVSLMYEFDSDAELQDFRSLPGGWSVAAGKLTRQGTADVVSMHTIAWFALPVRVEGELSVLSEPTLLSVGMGEVTLAPRSVEGPFSISFLPTAVEVSTSAGSVRLNTSPPRMGRVALHLSTPGATLEWLRIEGPLQPDWATARARLLEPLESR